MSATEESTNGTDYDGRTAHKLIQKYKVRFTLVLFLVSGFFIHLLLIEYEPHLFLGFPAEFYSKAADAIVIAGIVGITYEWYAKQARTHELRNLISEEVEAVGGDDEISDRGLKLALSDLFSNDSVALFSIFEREEGTDLAQHKIKNATENVKIIGEFRVGSEELADDSGTIRKYYRAKKERLEDDAEIEFYHVCPAKEDDDSWLDSHINLFEAAENPGSQYFLLHTEEHSPHMTIILIDDSYVIIDLKEDRTGFPVKDTKLVMTTSHETIVGAFQDYYDSIYDEERAIESADVLKSVIEE